MKWLPFSSDLNPIEHIWDELAKRMKNHHPENKEELKGTLMPAWNGIGINITEKLVDSVSNCLYECMRVHGYPTRY